VLAVGDAALFAYLLLDNWALLGKLHLLHPPPATGVRAARAWAVASAAVLVVALWRLAVAERRWRRARLREARGGRAADGGGVGGGGRLVPTVKGACAAAGGGEEGAAAARVAWTEGPKAVKAAADLVVATGNATQGGVSEVAVGSAGVLGALVGVFQLWPRV